MRPHRILAGVAGLALAAAPGAVRANNDLSTSYRAGSISPPSIDGASSSESAAVGVNQGRASYAIPLVAPPGVAGLEPSLSLAYGGTQSDGELGAGWSLAVPRLRVRTSGRGGQPEYGVGVTYQGFSGEDLIETGTLADADADGHVETVFREERDQAFVRYVALSAGGWRADFPDGRKLTLGVAAADRVVRAGQATAIAEWLPETLQDPRGNQLRYTWSTAVSQSATAVSPTARYLTEIRYGCRACASDPTYQRVRLTYTPRSAPRLDFGPGFAIETELLLATVETATVVAGTAAPVRTVSLTYTTSAGQPRLTSVGVVAADGATLPATRFTYSDGAPPSAVARTVTAVPGVLFKSGVQPFDLDLDGRVDVVDLSTVTSAKWYPNTGSGAAAFSTAATAIAHPPGKALSASGTTSLDDSNRDSALDVFDLGTAKRFAHNGVDGWDGTGVAATLPPIAWSANTLRADVDRDGHIDLIDTSVTPWAIYLDDGAGTFTAEIITCTTGTPTVGSALHAASDGVLTGDVNGDGLIDIVYIATARTSASVFYGRGRGCWGWLPEDGHGVDSAASFPIASAVSGPTRVATSLADVTGDGHDDLVMFDATAGRVNAWAFTPGTGWSDAGMGGPFVQTISSSNGCRLADVDADGVTEAMCSNGWKVYDWASESRHLLVTADNGAGVVTTLRYTTSAVIAAQHRAAGHPWTRNVGTALALVASTESNDGRGDVLVTSYDYRDPAIEVDELEDRAEFAGFAYIAAAAVPYLEYATGSRVVDPADPGVVTRSWYDLGLDDAIDWYRHGVKVCEESWPVSATPTSYACGGTGALRRTEDTYTPELDAAGFATVTLDARDEHVLEGAATGPWLHTAFGHDAYGNRTQVWAYGQWSGAADHTGDDEQASITNYILDATSWNLRLPKRMRRGGIDASGAAPAIDQVEATYLRYDGAAAWNVATVGAGLRTATDRWTYDPVTGVASTDTVEQNTYTTAGLPDRTTDAVGVVTDLDYDGAFGMFVVRETLDRGGLGLITRQTVDARTGKVTEVIDPDGAITDATYDLLGRLTSVVNPGDTAAAPSLTRAYTAGAPLSTITDVRKDGTADGLISTSLLDGNARVICESKEAVPTKVDVLAQHEYSARGLVAVEWMASRRAACETIALSASGRAVVRAHDDVSSDPLGRPLRRTHQPGGSVRSWSYAPLAITEATENDNDASSPNAGTTTRRTVDGRGRIVTVTEAIDGDGDGLTEAYDTRYAWTAADHLATVTDPLGATVFHAIYDSRGRRVASTDPDRGTIGLTYDAVDRVATSLDARGAALAYTYDGAGRVVTESTALAGVAGPTSTYHYDAPAPGYTAASCHNTTGRLGYVEDATGKTVYCYDGSGHAIRIDKTITALGATPLRLDRTFDSLDRIKTMTHPDGSKLTWTYGKDSRASRLQLKGGAGANAPTYDVVAAATYGGGRELTQLTLGNGSSLTLTYDERLRPLRSLVKTGATVLQDLTLSLDGVGNVTAITDGAGTHLSASFGHDAIDRLTSASGERYGNQSASYAYDVRGNLITKHSTATGTPLDVGAITYRADRLHAVDTAAGHTFAYDGAGNLVDDGDFTYSYDAHGMLATATAAGGSAPVMTNAYDYQGHRAVKDSSGGADVYYFPEAGLEIRGGVHIKYLGFAGRTVARVAGTFTDATTYAAATRFLVGDHLGGPSLVLDTTGAVVERWCGYPHGEDDPEPALASGHGADFRTADDPTTVLTRRFQGREVNAEDGTYDFGARVYRPDLGRFMSPDSIIPDPGSSQSWNRYAFARNNPLAFVDPSGHSDDSATTPVAPIADQAAVDEFSNGVAAKAVMSDTAKGELNDFLSRYAGDTSVSNIEYTGSNNTYTANVTAGVGVMNDGVGGGVGGGVTAVSDAPDTFFIEVTTLHHEGNTVAVTRDRLDLQWGLGTTARTEAANVGGEVKGVKAAAALTGPTQWSGNGVPQTTYRFRSVTTTFDVDVYQIRLVTPDRETWRTQAVLHDGSWNVSSRTDNGDAALGQGWQYETAYPLYRADTGQ